MKAVLNYHHFKYCKVRESYICSKKYLYLLLLKSLVNKKIKILANDINSWTTLLN